MLKEAAMLDPSSDVVESKPVKTKVAKAKKVKTKVTV